jgi:hypothetical protein
VGSLVQHGYDDQDFSGHGSACDLRLFAQSVGRRECFLWCKPRDERTVSQKNGQLVTYRHDLLMGEKSASILRHRALKRAIYLCGWYVWPIT